MGELRVLLLDEIGHNYLKYVWQEHCLRGIDPSELEDATAFQRRLNQIQTVDFSKLGKAELTPTDKGVALEFKEDKETGPSQT